MLRVESNTKLEGFTEFEEDILFDQDDPDFERKSISPLPVIFRVSGNMSLAGVYAPPEVQSSNSSLKAVEDVMTIEELRLQMSSCFTCGVSWSDSHVSLDCSECGGYALERPCPDCEGSCGAAWKRDLSMSHASGKARWLGECQNNSNKEPARPELEKKLSVNS